jgi:hypothetical protein
MIAKPSPLDAPPYCHPFIDLIATNDLITALQSTHQFTLNVFSETGEQRKDYRYAPGKWSIGEVLRHIVECERVYAYRAMRFSRGDTTPLPGFNEENYIQHIAAVNYKLSILAEEYDGQRKSTIALFQQMSKEMLDFTGYSNGHSITPRALGYMCAGHNLHHCTVIRHKYI